MCVLGTTVGDRGLLGVSSALKQGFLSTSEYFLLMYFSFFGWKTGDLGKHKDAGGILGDPGGIAAPPHREGGSGATSAGHTMPRSSALPCVFRVTNGLLARFPSGACFLGRGGKLEQLEATFMFGMNPCSSDPCFPGF